MAKKESAPCHEFMYMDSQKLRIQSLTSTRYSSIFSELKIVSEDFDIVYSSDCFHYMIVDYVLFLVIFYWSSALELHYVKWALI